ncbi:MAG TPA: aldo/keto reductase [Marmoricola sp.]|nr:aldo/keto reductase [Marmoricola sp.]
MTTPMITLNNGVAIPQLGFGVFQVPDDETAAAVSGAIAVGYRSIDTAAVYFNEAGVAQGIADSGIAREELFITTKVWNSAQGYDSTLKAFDESAERLGLDQVDLYLIHWPTPEFDTYLETWRALETLVRDGRIRAAGVSNFQPAHLQRVFDSSDLVPAVNQIELHPGLQQNELQKIHAEHGIATEAWSPLGRGAILDDPVITAISARLGKTPAQVVLRWHIQLGNIVIPKSVTPSRIAENIQVFDFALTNDDMADIAAMDRGQRIGPNPDEFNVR